MPQRAVPRLALLAAWLALLALLGAYVQHSLDIAADLRLFMPAPRTPAERLLIGEIGEGPARAWLRSGGPAGRA